MSLKPPSKPVAKKKKSKIDLDSVMAEILAEIEAPTPKFLFANSHEKHLRNPRPKFFQIDVNFLKQGGLKFEFPRRITRKGIMVFTAATIVLAGFWGPQILRAAHFPLDPRPFTALYFQNPEIEATGLVSGDFISFGIKNGSREKKDYHWKINSGRTTIKAGSISILPNTDKLISAETVGAIPGSKLEIYVSDLKLPITVQVIG
jgi:3D (Asp-Asp-Asp) domain-containing protein